MEKRAVSALRTFHWAEATFRRGAYVDADADGEGEFGTLEQLAGTAPLPSGRMLPASLVPEAGVTGGVSGEVVMGGYCFAVYLPGTADERERRFVAYAWPERGTSGGTLAFCVDQDEDILQTEAAGRYVGCDRAPQPGACLSADEDAPPADGPKGDGAVWRRWRGKTSRSSVGARPATSR